MPSKTINFATSSSFDSLVTSFKIDDCTTVSALRLFLAVDWTETVSSSDAASGEASNLICCCAPRCRRSPDVDEPAHFNYLLHFLHLALSNTGGSKYCQTSDHPAVAISTRNQWKTNWLIISESERNIFAKGSVVDVSRLWMIYETNASQHN